LGCLDFTRELIENADRSAIAERSASSLALWGEITLKNGRVEQSNFNDYRVLRMNESPRIEVHLVRNGEPPGGMGEPGTAVTAPALANAVFAATGRRIRKLPLSPRNA
jgi:isoquinoline 1-oxidoreductase beta subunit